jgi:hypothetical protein
MVMERVCVAVVIDAIVPQLPTLSSRVRGAQWRRLRGIRRKFRKVGVEKI